MTTETSYTAVRARLKQYCDQVTSTREPVIIHRREAEDVALVSADELESLMETAHLLRSPANAKRLLQALVRAQCQTERPSTVEQLKKQVGLKR